MTRPWSNTWLPVAMAKRMAFNRSYGTAEKNGFLEVYRFGQYVGAMPIADGAVRYIDMSGLLAVHVPEHLPRVVENDKAAEICNWLRRQANAENDPAKREAFIEAHNAALKIKEGQ